MATPTVGEGTRVCYLYGVVRVDRRPMLEGIAGIGGGPLAFVAVGSLAAVVGDVAREDLRLAETDRDDRALEHAVLAHEHVLERCLVPGPVLPMRFATTLRESGDVRTLLSEHGAEFEAVLDRLLGRREWGLKAILRDREALARHVRAARADLAAAEAELEDRSPGAAYLVRKRLDREISLAGDRVVADVVSVAHERLTAAAVGARLPTTLQPRSERVYLNAAYLVAETDELEFQQAVAALRSEHAEIGLDYELTGPWPAYNFVDEEVR